MDAGDRGVLTTAERAELVELHKKNRRLQRPNDILQAAASSSGRSSTADKRSRRWGVEPICTELQFAPPPITPPKHGHRRPGPLLTLTSDPIWPSCGSATTRSLAGAGSERLPTGTASTSAGTRWLASCNQGRRGASRAKKRFTTKSDPTAVRVRSGRASSPPSSSSTCSPAASSAGRQRVR